MRNVLTDHQRDCLWQALMESEARANFFGHLASRESSRKRWVTGLSFFLSSAAIVTLLANHPYLSLVASVIVAIMNGYTIAVNQDNTIKVYSRLQTGWLNLNQRYNNLWSHIDDEDAEERMERYEDRGIELSVTAASEVPHNEKLWKRCLQSVYKKHETNAHHEQEQRSDARE